MMALSKWVLDRVQERKNELKGRMYGLVEIMSRSVFARMQKRTSLYKDLLDQLVEQVFNKFTQELNEAWRDGCAHGRDLELSLNQHISNDEECGLNSEIDNDSLSISTFESQTSLSEQSLDDDADYDGEEYYSIMAPMDGVDQCVLDRVEERKIEFKERAYGLLEIMSRTVFASMVKRTSVYKNLLDQLVDQVFAMFTQQLNDAWRGGCAHGRDEWKGYLDYFDIGAQTSFEDQPEMIYLDSIGPLSPQQSSSLHSNEDSSLHSSPNPSQPSSQSQHQNIIQHVSDSGVMSESVPISTSPSQASSPQQSIQECKLFEEVHDGEYTENSCDDDVMGSMCTDDQDKEQSEEYDRDDQISANDEKLSLLNGQVDGDGKNDEDDPHGVDQLNGLEHRNNIDVTDVIVDQLAQKISTGIEKVPNMSPTGKHVCKLCGNEFKTGHNLAVHTRTHTGYRPYKCPKCVQTFYHNSNMKQHFKSQHEKLRHLCTHCDRAFLSQFKLETHIRMHTDHKLFVCTWENCRNAFTRKKHLNDHMCSHTGEKPYKCPWKDCTKVYTYRTNLQTHFKVHIDKISFKCPWEDCHEEFVQLKYFRVHAKYHTGNRPVKGLRSEEVEGEIDEGRIMNNLVQGDESSFENLPTSKHVCEFCGKGFKTGYNLTLHTRTHTGDRPYKCPKCPKTFKQNGHMKDHIKSQHDKLKHLCTHCDRAFQSQFKLETHIRIHTGHKLFVCIWENCRNAFTRKDHLNDHMCSHTGVNPHKCPWKDCTKVFTHIGKWKTHFKVHIDKMPFKCPWEDCHKEFVQLKYFRFHAKHHTGNRPVKGLRSEEVEGESDEGRIMKNLVQGDESSFENALPIGNEENLLSVNGEIDDDDGDIEMVNESEHRENQFPIQNMPNIHQPEISNKCSRTVERPCPFAWGGCTKTFTDDGHLQKHLELIHSHHHSSKHQNSNKVDQYVLHSEIVTESVQISSTLSQPLAQLLPNINKVDQYVTDDSKNDQVGENEMEEMDEPQIGNCEELPMADDLHGNEHGDCQLNGHKHGSNIEGADTRIDQLAQNIQSGQVVVSDKPPKGKHVCEQCGKGFKQPSALTRHIQMHTGERPYVCPHENCAKAFTQIGAMRIHHRNHTGELPHVCEQCGKTFSTNSKLTRHIRTHTGERPYKCPHCRMTFTQSYHLQQHRMRKSTCL